MSALCRERRGVGGGEELIRYYFISPTKEHGIEWSETGTPGEIGRKKRVGGGCDCERFFLFLMVVFLI